MRNSTRKLDAYRIIGRSKEAEIRENWLTAGKWWYAEIAGSCRSWLQLPDAAKQDPCKTSLCSCCSPCVPLRPRRHLLPLCLSAATGAETCAFFSSAFLILHQYFFLAEPKLEPGGKGWKVLRRGWRWWWANSRPSKSLGWGQRKHSRVNILCSFQSCYRMT